MQAFVNIFFKLIASLDKKIIKTSSHNITLLHTFLTFHYLPGYYFYDHPSELVPPCSMMGEGWYNTGDVVEIDREGFVTIKGRVKRFAKIAGEMVSLEAVEKIANRASPEHQHAAVAQADAQRGEALVLYTTDSGLKREHLLEAARAIGSPELAVPKKLICLESLPLLGTGKTDYVSLKKKAEHA